MKILINNLNSLLSEKLTLLQRGILITILILKDFSPKLTLAKAKTKINFTKNKVDLIHLHKAGFIEWSGYNKALRSMEEKAVLPEVVEIIDFMNGLYGTGFKSTTKSITINIVTRLKENSIDDLKLVVANRYSIWKDDPFMGKYLKPDTIFRASKFPKYLEEARRTKQGESFLNASKLGIKKGDLITYDLSKTFSDDDVYTVRVYSLADGSRIGSGRVEKMYGKGIKRSLKVLNNIKNKETEYTYEGK